MRAELPTGVVTLVFTDIEGSTKLLHELGDEVYTPELKGVPERWRLYRVVS